MNWYIAKIVFNIDVDAEMNRPQFDEQYRLIRSANYEDAFEKAIELGRREEEILLNHQSKLIHWKFINVAELFPIDELRDGMELFSGTHEPDDKQLYIETIHLKAEYIKSKFDLIVQSA